MFTDQEVTRAHQGLTNIFKSSLVLLGGSYLTGQQTNDSDLDFYIITNVFNFLSYKSKKGEVDQLKQKFPGKQISIILMPYFFYKHGWYYAIGKDRAGNFHSSGLNKNIIFRTALKLAYFNYLGFLVTNSQYNLRKSVHHLLTANILLAGGVAGKNGFDIMYVAEFAIKRVEFSELVPGLTGKITKELVYRHLEQTYQAGTRLLKFSLVNYLLYNLRFLLKGNLLFLNKNPDKIILLWLKKGIIKNENLKILYTKVKKIIFPVLMF